MSSILRSLFVAAALLAVGVAFADSIEINGVTYEDVYVREGKSLYFVQIPEDGTVKSVLKEKVRAEDVSINLDEAHRAQLLVTWRSNNVARNQAMLGLAPAGAGKTDGASSSAPVLQREGVALSAQATPGNQIARENSPVLPDHGPTAYTPKFSEYVMNSAVSSAKAAVSSGFGQSGFGGGRGGQGMGGQQGGFGAGMSGAGRGGQGGFGQGRGGQGGFGGGIGGGQGGFGGGGGGQGGFRGGGGHFSNISELFFTIDDRLVGETPAVIGLSIVYPRNTRAN